MSVRILVCCPHFVTGGPELLHQLVRQLCDAGHDAGIVYMPIGPRYETPEPYRKYAVPQQQWADESNVLVVVPEPFTILLKQLKKASAVVWWLSVDNYYYFSGDSPWSHLRARLKLILKGRLSLSQMHGYRHLAQSRYAIEFLKRNGLESTYLSDYLGEEHLRRQTSRHREDIVVFNPKKGYRRTRRLIEQNPGIQFIPLVNLSSAGVADLLGRAKIYIDFGHHPGKDRAPREAVMAGCCVITGRRGAAQYHDDVPIPERYKLDDRSRAYLREFRALAQSIFSDYDAHFANFGDYRKIVAAEPARFAEDVRRAFGAPAPGGGGGRPNGSPFRI